MEEAVAHVQKNGLNLKYMENNFKNNKIIVKEAVKNNSKSFLYASINLKKNKKFIIDLIKIDPKTLKYADEEIKSDDNFIYNLYYGISKKIIKYMSPELKSDYKYIKKFLDDDEYKNFKLLPEKIKKDKNIIKSCVKKTPFVFLLVKNDIKLDVAYLKDLINIDTRVFDLIPLKYKTNRRLICGIYDIKNVNIKNIFLDFDLKNTFSNYSEILHFL